MSKPSRRLEEGVRLTAIHGQGNDPSWYANQSVSIIIREQMGEYSLVPWAEVNFDNGERHLVNLNKVLYVEFEEK